MRTVREVSNLTGISVRTLHYYDEIGLLRPSALSEGGYRLYDDRALGTLRQILFFRELDMPLKQIMLILGNPGLDRHQLLSSQKKMLELKKVRLERIIASIEDILKGDNSMDFSVFSKAELEQMYLDMERNMTEAQKKIFVNEFGSMEAFKEQFLNHSATEKAQKHLARAVEWYGGKDSAIAAATHPNHAKITEETGKKLDLVMKRLAAKTGADVDAPEVIKLVEEMDSVSKQLYQMKDVTAFMRSMADKYVADTDMQKRLDAVYGEGSTLFIGQVLQAFYQPAE